MPFDPRTGGFLPYSDPSEILDVMRQMHEGSRGGGGYSRMPAVEESPGEALERDFARKSGMPTMWGKVMNRRYGGIQGQGIAGALGKSIKPGGSNAQLAYENEALANQYPLADLMKRFR